MTRRDGAQNVAIRLLWMPAFMTISGGPLRKTLGIRDLDDVDGSCTPRFRPLPFAYVILVEPIFWTFLTADESESTHPSTQLSVESVVQRIPYHFPEP